MAGFSIDQQFARFGSTRYATDKITSFTVRSERRKVQGTNDRFTGTLLGTIGVLAGLALAGASLAERQIGRASLGVAICAFGIWQLWRTTKLPSDRSRDQTIFKLVIVTNAGEVAAFETTSSAEISEVESALEQAIVDSRR